VLDGIVDRREADGESKCENCETPEKSQSRVEVLDFGFFFVDSYRSLRGVNASNSHRRFPKNRHSCVHRGVFRYEVSQFECQIDNFFQIPSTRRFRSADFSNTRRTFPTVHDAVECAIEIFIVSTSVQTRTRHQSNRTCQYKAIFNSILVR
jgi:hypothetical protein